MLAEAKPAPAWMIDHLDVRGYDLCSPEGQTDTADAMLDTLLSLPPIERGTYVRRLAERMEIPEPELRAALNDAYVRSRDVLQEPLRRAYGDDSDASVDIP
jgi:primase-like protein